MSKKTNYLETEIIDHIFNKGAWTAPATMYAALHTADPTETGAVGELSGSGYARTAVAWGSSSGGSIQNNATVSFPQATAPWGTVTHFSLWDASSGGNALYYGTLAASKTIATDDIFEFLSGGITISEL